MLEKVRIIKLSKENFKGWVRPLFEFLKQQDPKDYPDYMLPIHEKDYGVFDFKLTSLVRDQDLALNDGSVPTDYYIILIGNTVIGIAEIRKMLDKRLIHEFGHLGIGIGVQFRGHGYGTEALGQLLEKCKCDLELYDVMLAAQDSNEAAIRMIEANDGKWVTEVDSFFRLRKVSVYWVRFPIPKDSVAQKDPIS